MNCPQPVHKISEQISLINRMRLAWSQHVYWTRMLLISLAAKAPDAQDTAARLLQNPADMGAVFKEVFPRESVAEFEDLLTDHLQIGGALIVALRDGKKEEAAALDKKWHENADQLADWFGMVSPNYDRGAVQKMFYDHLDLTSKEVAARLAGKYPDDIAAFNTVEKEAMNMAEVNKCHSNVIGAEMQPIKRLVSFGIFASTFNSIVIRL